MGSKGISFNWVGGIIRCLVTGNFIRDIISSKISGWGTGLVGTSFYLSLPSSVLCHTSCEEVPRFFSLPRRRGSPREARGGSTARRGAGVSEGSRGCGGCSSGAG